MTQCPSCKREAKIDLGGDVLCPECASYNEQLRDALKRALPILHDFESYGGSAPDAAHDLERDIKRLLGDDGEAASE